MKKEVADFYIQICLGIFLGICVGAILRIIDIFIDEVAFLPDTYILLGLLSYMIYIIPEMKKGVEKEK